MRCMACDSIMTPREDSRKFEGSGERVQLCDNCFRHISEDVSIVEDERFLLDDDHIFDDPVEEGMEDDRQDDS